MKKSSILLCATALILMATSVAYAGGDTFTPGNYGTGVSQMPGMGLSYPSMQAPEPAQPGQAVPYSAQQTIGGEVPAAAAQQEPQNNNQDTNTSTTTKNNQANDKPTKTEKAATQAPVVVQEYDDNGEPYSKMWYRKESLPHMAIAMLRRPEFKPGQFMIRLIPREQTTGCVKISKIPSTVDFKENSIDITLENFTVDARHLTSAPEYNCDLHPKNPTADIIFDRDDLTSKGIKYLKLKISNSGDKVGMIADTYDVDINKERIRLKPDKLMQRTPLRFNPYQLSNIRTPLTHWFYPEGTVILYVPGAKGQNVTDQVISMAKAKGLEPITDEWPDFHSPFNNDDQWFFIDKKGAVAKNPDIKEGTIAGTVQISETIYGLEKDEKQNKDIPVFARTPNSYE